MYFIPVTPKDMVGYSAYRKFMNKLSEAVAEDSAARISIVERRGGSNRGHTHHCDHSHLHRPRHLGTISFWTDGAYKRNRPDQDSVGIPPATEMGEPVVVTINAAQGKKVGKQ